MTVFVKDPDSITDYTINWGDGYLDTNSPAETISTSSWAVSPADSPGMSVSGTPTKTTTTATAFVTGGVVGRVYALVNTITTSGGRTDERSIILRVEER